MSGEALQRYAVFAQDSYADDQGQYVKWEDAQEALAAKDAELEAMRRGRDEAKEFIDQLQDTIDGFDTQVERVLTERDAALAEAGRLRAALAALHDEQNGAPLARREKQWSEAMAQAERLLTTPTPAPDGREG